MLQYLAQIKTEYQEDRLSSSSSEASVVRETEHEIERIASGIPARIK